MPKGFQKGHIPKHKGSTLIFKDPEARANKIRIKKIGVKRPPLTEEWKRKISESGKLSNAGKYIRTPEMRKNSRIKNLGKKLNPEHKRKVRNALISINKKRSGKNHHNWKGGITPINEKIRQSSEYKQWRTAVFKRDNYTCLECKVKNVYIQADHIKPFAFFIELRFDLNNGRTLCVSCHRKTPTYGSKKEK